MGRHLLLLLFILTYVFAVESYSFAKDIKYSVTERPEGGYTLNISYSKRHWIPITAEGMFPLEEGNYTIDVIGKGRKKTFWNGSLEGYYYTQEDIKSLSTLWNFGYAWIDADREYLYLNLYWASFPDSIVPSKINGKYKLKN